MRNKKNTFNPFNSSTFLWDWGFHVKSTHNKTLTPPPNFCNLYRER